MPSGRSIRAALIAVFVCFNAFAVLRAFPVNTADGANNHNLKGDYDRNVVLVLKKARANAAQPFSEVRDHALYFDRNPALFMFAAELFVRAGADSATPIQCFSIVLWNVGLALCFLWLRRFFGNDWLALSGLAFAAFTPYVIFNSTSIHNEPYAFMFVYFTLYVYTRYLESPEVGRKWLIATFIGYFLVCQCYWFYYLNTYLMLLALQVKHERFSLRQSFLIGLTAVAGLITTFAQVVYARGGIAQAYHGMAEIAAARTGDFRIEGSTWYPDKTFVRASDLQSYPLTLLDRVTGSMGFSGLALLLALLGALLLAGKDARTRYRWLPLALLAAFSWNLVMVQHTVIHQFAAMYGHLFWVLVPGIVFSELARALKPEYVRPAMLALAIPFAASALSHGYAQELPRHFEKATRSEAEQKRLDEKAAAQKKLKKKAKGKIKVAVADIK